MGFSQTFGRALENRPVIYAEPSQGKRNLTVPASALCAPSHFASKASFSQPPPRLRQSYSPPGPVMKASWLPSCPGDE
jgi:hypothetical protein